MRLAEGFPPLLGDPGGGTAYNGLTTGPTLPGFMDPTGEHGNLVLLKLEPVYGKMPDNPFTLRTSIEKWVKGKIAGATPQGGGKTYVLEARSQKQIDRLLEMKQLSDGTAIRITEDPDLNSVRCVINCRDLMNITEDEEIINELKPQKVTGIRRITRKVGDKNELTPTVILTVSGTSRPEHIDVGYRRYHTRPYYPAPMLCYNCYSFGHTRKRCKQTTSTCGHCGQQHEVVRGVQCVNEAFCNRCKTSEHSLSSRRCPVYKMEDEIQHLRVDRGIQYPEARRLFAAATRQSSFAGITVYSKDKAIADLQSQIATLTKQMAEKDEKIKTLEAHASNGPSVSGNEEFQSLKNLVEELKSQVESRDLRIQALEVQLRKDSRLEIVKKHGTIEDLIARVAALEATTARKDEELVKLRKENEDFRKIISQKTLGKYQQKQAAKELASASTSATKNDTSREKASDGTPKPKGAIPKTKKALEMKSSEERDPKRKKADDRVMEISDDESSPNATTTNMNPLQSFRNGFFEFSDEGVQDENEEEILP